MSAGTVRSDGSAYRQTSTGLCDDILFGFKLVGGEEGPRVVNATGVEVSSGEGVPNKLETQRRWPIWLDYCTLYVAHMRRFLFQVIESTLTALSSIFWSSILVFENCSTLILTTRFLFLADAGAAGIGILFIPAVTLIVTYSV